MVGGSVPPTLTLPQAQEYIANVKEALNDEPEKFHEFVKILHYVITHRSEEVTCFARVEELMKDHRDLLLGFYAFLPPETKIALDAKRIILPKGKTTITAEAKTIITSEAKTTITSEAKTAITSEAKTIIPLEAKGIILTEGTTITSEAKKIIPPPDADHKDLGQFQTMAATRAPRELTMDDALPYVVSVKEAFRDEPGKNDEFRKILHDYRDQRFDRTSAIARVKQLMKEHPNLLLGLNIFLPDEANTTIPPEANRTILPESNRPNPTKIKITITPKIKITIPPQCKRTIPPEANKELCQFQNIVERRLPTELVKDHALSDIDAAKEVCHDERSYEASGFARAEELMKDNRNLLQLSAEDNKLAILPEAENHGAESNCTKRKREECDGQSFLNKLQTRFRSLDTHVVESFREIMKAFKEGKKSGKEVHEEVVDLLYYHEDLIEDFSRFLKPKKSYRFYQKRIKTL